MLKTHANIDDNSRIGMLRPSFPITYLAAHLDNLGEFKTSQIFETRSGVFPI